MDMVERVAMAMAGTYLEALHPDDAIYWREKSIAAIEAMREPEPYMAEAAYDKAGVPILDFRAGWHAAIDSILKSTRETA